MSFYRSLAVAVAAMGLAVSVFAADESTATTQSPAATQTQTTDASSPATTTTTTTTTSSTSAAADMSKVDINKASVKELKAVKGLSANKAKSIVAYRKKHGDFKSLDELKEVKGFKKMNEETMKGIQEHLTIG